MVTTVLFDVDGTLIDSNDAHADSWVEAIRSEGFRVEFEDIRPLIGMGGDRILPIAIGVEEKSPQGKRITERRKQLFLEAYLPRLKPFPGVRDLLTTLKAQGLKLATASSSGDFLLNELLKKAGVADQFAENPDNLAGKEEGAESKPAPDIVVAALEKTHALPTETILIGDTPYDIEAARRAGVPTIAFQSGGWPVDALKGAIAIYKDPRELLSRLSDSPLAKGGRPASVYFPL